MIGYFAAWLALVFANMPVAFSLVFMGMVWLFLDGVARGDADVLVSMMSSAPQRLIGGIDSFPLLAVPCFILAGIAMNTGGVTERIYGVALALVGHLTGGLGHVNGIGSVIFSGMSGSAIADAAGLGLLEIKAMKEDGYPADFAGALTCASCIIGPLIPPSIPMVLYGVIANASVGALFLAGVMPGLMTAAVLMVQVYFYARKRNIPKHPRASLRVLWTAFRRAFLALVTPVIIMGGIFGGIFTPTEAAAVAAIYSLALGLFVYGDLKWSDLPRILKDAVSTSAVVGFIVAGASLFSWVLARERVPQQIAEAFLGLSDNPHVILLVINVVMLILGCFMEGIAIMILMVPVFMPVIQQLGIDPVHFGVIVTMNLMIGILTPPFGVALFTVTKVGGIPFEQLARAIMPFLPPLILVLFVITHFPATAMWLPWWVYGN